MLRSRRLSLLVFGVFASCPGGTHAAALNDTGQIACYDQSTTSTGTVSSGTPAPEAVGFQEQDCSLGAAAADAAGVQIKVGGSSVKGRDYTKIGFDGSELPDTAERGVVLSNGWGCTRDNVTGLTWALSLVSFDDSRYSWGSSPNDVGDTCGGGVCNSDSLASLINQLNVCGASDWTLPTPSQLGTLFAYDAPGAPGNLIDRVWFPDQSNNGTDPFVFWTQIPQGNSAPPSIWVADFATGRITTRAAQSPAYVRLVRGGSLAAAPRFVTSAPGPAGEVIITDALTGLIWKQCPEGLSGADCAGGARSALSWSGALGAAASTSFAGFGDWRLPNINELASIRDYTAINDDQVGLAGEFKGTTFSEAYWSSTNDPGLASLGSALGYRYGGGSAHVTTSKTSGTAAVRLVRAGNFLAAHAPGADLTPDGFAFAGKNARISSVIESDPITVAGISGPVSLKVSGAAQSAHSINGGSWTSLAGAARNGDSIRLRHQAAASLGDTATTTLNIGGVTSGFTSTVIVLPPTAPTAVTATRGNASVALSFTAPANNGGSDLTGYTATSTPAGGISNCAAPPARSCSVNGLSNGQSYTFTIIASNGAGSSAPSAASNAVTPATVPDAPTTASAVAGIGQATVSFTAPLNNGGAAISGYTATSTPEGRTGTCTATPCTVSGLSNGQTYTFSVTATNAVGSGAASVASNSVTMPTSPGAPTNVVAAGTSSPATVSFSAPASTGGSAILDYTVTSSPGSLTNTCSASPCTVDGLSPGTSYTFTVRARNAVGLGPNSAASNALVPGTASSALGTPLGGVVQVVSGDYHACARTSTGSVKCWGTNSVGQLGDGTTSDRSMPVDVPGLASGVRAIAAGENHTCAVTAAGGVKCWGYNFNGQLGDGSTIDRSTPVDMQGLGAGISAIAAGGGHTCALSLTGAVTCWGANGGGQLGDNSTLQRLTPVAVQGLGSGISAVSAGGEHTCALGQSGGLKCWGSNVSGQLGDNSLTDRLTPVDVQGLTTGVSVIAAGNKHTCAVTQAGGVRCWGYNDSGQLGDASNTDRQAPVDVQGLVSGITAVTAGFEHSCALAASGAVTCWGNNRSGQLGDNTFAGRATPGSVLGLGTGITGIVAGGYHSCALGQGGRVTCWGDNSAGQLGDGTLPVRPPPVDVPGLGSGIRAVAAGHLHGCAVGVAGGVKCWGANGAGQLGDNTTTQRLTPLNVQGLGDVVAVAAGADHSCALTQAGAVRCWGANSSGQLGNGSTQGQLTPVAVQGLASGVVAIAAGSAFSCALTQGGGVKCWGANGSGQLGVDGPTNSTTPGDVDGLGTGVIAIAAGHSHACAVTQGGGVKCWGLNSDRQLGGSSAAEDVPTPADVMGLTSAVTSVAAGQNHTCALGQGGGVVCWGSNTRGQLGDSSTGDFPRATPVPVTGLGSGVAMIATGASHSCARTVAGGLKCWGSNRARQLGDGGSATDRTAPVDVQGLSSGVTSIATGTFHTCAVTGAGSVKCWGEHLYGQLGVGGRNYALPAEVLIARTSTVFKNGFEP